MNYPVWYIPEVGGGLLIAIIAIVHVFISHFAVGGGLYLVFAERKGLREKNRAILDFTKSHAKFFLLMTLVAGGVTGVAIWFIISLVHPAATSLLIHIFVFGWATEWVLFMVEIVAIFVYFYTFGRMDDRTHQTIGWIYFIAAWLSLFVINGIINFMLDPGAWLTNGSFWSGFLFTANCTACHGEDLVESRTAGWDRAKVRKALDKLSAINPAMPDYQGSAPEKEIIADYVVSLNKPGVPAAAGHDRGEDLFEQHCATCHTPRAGNNPLLPKLAGSGEQQIRKTLDMLDKLKGGGMPPLNAPPTDKDSLARFLAASLKGGSQ